MSLRVIQAGFFSTIQDLGRHGFRDRGVPLGGAFDRTSAQLANALLGNDLGLALIELSGFGGLFEAETNLGLALAGAEFTVIVERPGERSRNGFVPSSFPVRQGDRVAIGGSQMGARAYLGVVDGFQVPRVLGSRSQENRIQVGDRLRASPSSTACRSVKDLTIEVGELTELRVVVGPDHLVDPDVAAELERRSYRVGLDSNRLGVRLEGEPIAIEPDPWRVSAPVAPGAVQLAGGLPIVLGVAAGTTGGYPHIAHLISRDLGRLAQVRPGQEVRFRVVSMEEARKLDREHRRSIAHRLLQIQTLSRDRGAD